MTLPKALVQQIIKERLAGTPYKVLAVRFGKNIGAIAMLLKKNNAVKKRKRKRFRGRQER